MNWNEEKQTWENLTEQEQQMADAMFKKGFAQAKKKVEEPLNNPPQATILQGPSAQEIADLIKQSVNQIVAPIQSEFEGIRVAQKETYKQSIIAKQQQKLPSTYLSLVKGESEEEVITSYNQVLNQYQEELKSIGLTSTFGAPTPTTNPTTTTNKKFSDLTPAEKIELCKSDPQLYSRLKNS